MQTQTASKDLARDPDAIAKARAQVADLKKMYADTAAARAERQRAKPLIERLGGRVARIRERLPAHRIDDFLRAFRFTRDDERVFREGARRIAFG